MDVDDVEIAGRQASGFNPMSEKKEDGVKLPFSAASRKA